MPINRRRIQELITIIILTEAVVELMELSKAENLNRMKDIESTSKIRGLNEFSEAKL